MTTTRPTPTTNQPARIIGLDIARAFAVVGMVIVNFKLTMGAEEAGPQWLRTVAAVFDGRAAATFVVLAGIGASLGSGRARTNPNAISRRTAQLTLAKRATFLFMLGWTFYFIWPADILHYYGIYLAVGSAVLFAPDKRLILMVVGVTAVSVMFIVVADPFENWDLDDYSYRGIATPTGFVRNLFFDGFHPVFPWVAFYLFGMWLGRTDLRDPRWRSRLVGWSMTAVVITEAAAWAILGPKGTSLDHIDDGSWRWLFSVLPIPPLPLYLVAGIGTAVLVVMGSIWLGEHRPEHWTAPLVATGQLALSIYVAHVVIGMGLLDGIGRLEDQSLAWAVGTSLVFCTAAVACSWWWRQRFDRGPVEWLMRTVAG
ncbi:MAG: DUF418 domain-containing protein [Desertimonas sp.]